MHSLAVDDAAAAGDYPAPVHRACRPSLRLVEMAALPQHPGTLLRDEILPSLGISPADVARSIGLSRTIVYRVLAGDGQLTPDMAARLARLTGVDALSLLAMQARYDLARVEHARRAELDAITPLASRN